MLRLYKLRSDFQYFHKCNYFIALQAAASLGHLRHGVLRRQLPRTDPQAGAAEEAQVPPDPNLHGLHRLPDHLLAGALPAPQQHSGETGHRYDDPPHTHLHVCQREKVITELVLRLTVCLIDIVQVSPARVLRDLPRHVDGLLHRLRLPGAGRVQRNLPPQLSHPV